MKKKALHILEKDQDEDEKETYKEALEKNLGLKSKIIQEDQEAYLLIIERISQLPDEPITLLLTNGFDKMHALPLTYEYMQSHREKNRIEGTWEAYFDLLKLAFGKQ